MTFRLLLALASLATIACGGGDETASTNTTDETYTTSGDELADDDPPEPDYDDPDMADGF